MALVIVNPRKATKRRKASTTKRNPAKKRATKGASQMAKKRRSPAQRAATKRMLLARNPRRRRKVAVHRNPRRLVRRRRVTNPTSFRRMRRRRNPSRIGGGGSFFKSMLDKQGLMLLAAVVATPTIMAEGQSMLFPNATGYYQAGIQGAIGVGLGWAAWKFLDKQVGHVVALIGVGTAVAELITGYNAGTLGNSTMSGMRGNPNEYSIRRGTLSTAPPSRESGARTLAGYTGRGIGGRAASCMSGYISSAMEPGVRRV